MNQRDSNVVFSYKDKIKIVNIFIYSAIIVFIISLVNIKFEWELLLGMQPLIIVIVYLERNSAVNILFYDSKMNINFYLICKQIALKYDEVIYYRNCWGRYSGTFIRFKAKHNEKIIYFKIKTYDDDLRKFINEKFVNYDSLKK